MTRQKRILKALSILLPAGAVGASIALASTLAEARVVPDADIQSPAMSGGGVADRLEMIRTSVSMITGTEPGKIEGDPSITLAWWGNAG